MQSSPIWFGSHYVRILARFDQVDDPHVLRFPTLHAARTFASRVLADPFGRHAVDRALERTARRPARPWLAQGPRDEALDQAARLFYRGDLVAVPVPVDVGWAELGEPVEEATAPLVSAQAWVELILLDDATGDPVGGIKLGVKLPNAARAEHTTPASGILTFDPCERGTCAVDSSMEGAALGNTLEVLGFGSPSKRPLEGIAYPNPEKRPLRLVQVTHHKVRKGESLASLAKTADISWQELAKFNFGTAVPKEINVALHEQVGCFKKTKDKKNYVFDDDDDPGMIYIPRPFRLTNLSTNMAHTLRVRRIMQPPRPFYFSC